ADVGQRLGEDLGLVARGDVRQVGVGVRRGGAGRRGRGHAPILGTFPRPQRVARGPAVFPKRRGDVGGVQSLRIMRRLASIAAAAALLAASAAAFAQAVVAGEVKKVDKPAGRITLKHAEIKLYDMPPLTGAYKVQDPG